MPLPEPTQGEAREEFLERCTMDADAREEFPDSGQRFSFCNTRFETTMRKSDEPRTLYISRPVINADELVEWAKRQGFETVYPPEDMHVTVAFSRRPIDWFDIQPAIRQVVIPAGGPRQIQRLGEDGSAVVLRFNAPALDDRFVEILNLGATWDFESYKPHITITLNAKDMDLSKVEPFQGQIILGLEKFTEVQENWREGRTEKYGIKATVAKVDKDMQVAWGWFSVVTEKGKPVVDFHGDIIQEKDLLQAAHNYMLESRAGKVMHNGRRVADVVESIVFTKELQDALGIDLGRVGWFGAMKYKDPDAWKKVKSGELSEFSIGGFSTRTPLE